MTKRRNQLKEVRKYFKVVCKEINHDPKQVEVMLFLNWINRIQEITHWKLILGEHIIKKGMKKMGKPKAKTKKAEEAEVDEATKGLEGDPLANLDFGDIATMALGETNAEVSMEDLDQASAGLDLSDLSPRTNGKGVASEAIMAQLDGLMATVTDVQQTVNSIGKSEQFTTQKLIRELSKTVENKLEELTKRFDALEQRVNDVMDVRVEHVPPATPETKEKAAPKAKAKPKVKAKSKKKRGRPKKVKPLEEPIVAKILQAVGAGKPREIPQEHVDTAVNRIVGAFEATAEQVYALLEKEGRISSHDGSLTLGS